MAEQLINEFTVTTDLHITGKIAQFGRGILGDVSTKLIDQFAQNLNEMIDADGVEALPADAAGESDTPVAEAPADDSPAQPTVRKIDGPAAEAIDLMEMGGSSIAKRAAPAVAVLFLLLLLLRRRRS